MKCYKRIIPLILVCMMLAGCGQNVYKMGKGHREVDSRWLFTFRRVLEAGRWQKYSCKDW